MDSVAVVFPHQLFRNNPWRKRDRIVYLAEDSWFFGGQANLFRFHRQKLILHRTSLGGLILAVYQETQNLFYHAPATQTFNRVS